MRQETSLGLNVRLERVLAYMFGWVSGIILFFLERNRSVRWHAAQSMITFGLLSILIFGISMLKGFLGLIFVVAWLSNPVLSLLLTALGWITGILWVWLMVMAFIREDYSLPIIGNWVRNLV